MMRGVRIAVRVTVWVAVLFSAGHMLSTGSPVPLLHIERLDSPHKVVGWSAEGLELADGRVQQLPGFTALPKQSEALNAATRGGVEITDEGRVIGRINANHWCGNDPYWRTIVRIDLAWLLMYLDEGEFDEPDLGQLSELQRVWVERRRYEFTRSGWTSRERNAFRRWKMAVQEASKADGRKATPDGQQPGST